MNVLATVAPRGKMGKNYRELFQTVYWSGNTHSLDAQYANVVSFGSGFMGNLLKTQARPIWCVRGGQLGSDIR